MKFYGNGSVWDKERNKALCRFQDGEYETDDERTVNLLIKGGYKHDGRETEPRHEERQETEKEPTFPELRKQAKEAGIEGYGKMKKQELIEALREGD